MKPYRMLVIGNPESHHVGAHLLQAAPAAGVDARLCDSRAAFRGSVVRQKVNWWLRGHRPSRLVGFGDEVLDLVHRFEPDAILATGIAPLERRVLREVGALGVHRVNFLTDDPWNPAHAAPWFMETLDAYDLVVSPRTANVTDLEKAGVRAEYLPFAYAPEVHFPDPPTDTDRALYDADVMFAGGADDDRVSAIAPFVRAGLKVALYGGYWERHAETRAHAKGMLDAGSLRRAVGGARICLGLVRHANRDGHSMRSFEVPATGGCMLTEDTLDHRALFGEDGDAVTYFSNADDAVTKALWLLEHPALCGERAARAHAIVTGGRHTYADRLRSIVAFLADGPSARERCQPAGTCSRA